MKRRFFSLFLVICMIASLMTGFTLTVTAESSGTCGAKLTWTLDDNGVLTISGSGKMMKWIDPSEVPWYSERLNIKNVTIESGVTSISDYAFSDCSNLTSIIVDSGNENFSSRDGNLFDKSQTILLMYAMGKKDAEYTIPNSVTSIEGCAFYGCNNLTSIIIPNSVTSIGYYAFSECSNLTDVYYTGTEDEWNSIYIVSEGNSYLTNATLHYNYIPAADDHIVASGTCGANLTWTLDDTYALTISGSGEMTNYSRSSEVPWYSEKLNITSITIESGVTSIGDFAFSECIKITNVTIPNSVISVGEGAFGSCYALTSVIIGNGVTNIGDAAFYDCYSLTSVTIPDNVKSIGDRAFHGCSHMTNVTIGDGVTSIGNSAFLECSNLTSIKIGSSVAGIGVGAFYSCGSLTSIEVDSNNAKYSSLDGNLFDKNKTTLIQYAIGKENTQYTFPNSVTSIGKDAFYGCSKLTSITIPNSVTSIGDSAFWSNYNLESVTIGNSVTSIDNSAFSYCNSLTSVTIGNSVTSIGDKAFYFCTKLTSIIIPDSVKSIGEYAFYSCYALTSATIGNGVISIGAWAFNDCRGLTTVIIGKGVTSIGKGAFCDGRSLTDVYYMGSEEQWREINIDSANTELENATIHYNYIPEADSNTISFDKENNSITIESTEVITQAEFLVVLYKDGRLVKIQRKPMTIINGTNTLKSPISYYGDSDTAKIMIWDDMMGMKSLFNYCPVNL